MLAVGGEIDGGETDAFAIGVEQDSVVITSSLFPINDVQGLRNARHFFDPGDYNLRFDQRTIRTLKIPREELKAASGASSRAVNVFRYFMVTIV